MRPLPTSEVDADVPVRVVGLTRIVQRIDGENHPVLKAPRIELRHQDDSTLVTRGQDRLGVR